VKTFASVAVIALLAFAHTIQAQVLIGEIGILQPAGEGATMVLLGVDEKAVDAFYKAIVVKDDAGIRELVGEGLLFGVPVGTKVKVLDSHGILGSTLEVRILEGQQKDRRGYVSSSLVSKSGDAPAGESSPLPDIFGGESDTKTAPDSASAALPSTAKPKFFKVRINERFRLGDFSYKVRKIASCREIGVGVKSVHQTAPVGKQYVVVTYVVQNEGQHTEERAVTDFSKDFELRSAPQHFSMDATATTALATSNSLTLRSLVPGASGTAVAVFNVPDQVAGNKFQIIVYEKDGPQAAVLSLVRTHSNSTTRPVDRTRRQSFGPGNPQYEEMRRETILNRPPGTSSVDFDPDWH
jgi:hypothetical protein